MNCPVCKESRLTPKTALEEGLDGLECPHCHGLWLDGDPYRRWADQHPVPKERTPARRAGRDPGTDTPQAKLCPGCGHIMLLHRVGHGLGFRLDACNGCGGLWLDPKEWDALKEAGLHTYLHRLATPQWQAEVRAEQSRKHLEKLFRERLGDEDFERMRDTKRWLEPHTHRNLILAYLGAAGEEGTLGETPTLSEEIAIELARLKEEDD